MGIEELESKFTIVAGPLRYEIPRRGYGRLLFKDKIIFDESKYGVKIIDTKAKKIFAAKESEIKIVENQVVSTTKTSLGELQQYIRPVEDGENSRMELFLKFFPTRQCLLNEFFIIDASLNGKKAIYFKHGWQSWSRVAVLPIKDKSQPIPIKSFRHMHFPTSDAMNRESSWVSSLHVQGEDITIGSVGQRRFFTRIVPSKSHLSVRCLGDLIPINTNGIESDHIVIIPGWNEALEKWAKLQGISSKAKPPSGWCSWYYFYANVKEEDIIRNAKAAAELGLPLEYIQLDDGYQKSMGDWTETNEKFPHGLEWLAARIKEYGFKAGIWLAPFLASKNSTVFERHQDWFITDRKGKPFKAFFNPNWRRYGPVFHLDISNPEVVDFVISTLTKLTEMGYEYLKLDFLYGGITEGKRHDPSRTRFEIYRDAFDSIRKALKGRAIILGCGAPLECSAGFFDAMRVSLDTSVQWKPSLLQRFLGWLAHIDFISMKPALLQSMLRWFTSEFWINDPDVLLVREPLNEEEMHTAVTGIALCGGSVFSSDELPKLGVKRVEQLLKTIPSLLPPAKPVDYTSREPQMWYVSGNKPMIAIINWSDKPQKYTIPASLVGHKVALAYEFWGGKVLGTMEKFELKIPPHGSRVLVFSSQNEIFLGTDLHISQPVKVQKEGDVISINVELPGKRHGKITLALPASANVISHDCQMCELTGGDIYRELLVDFKDAAHIKIKI
ncbi:MAG: alpha-galactosidase [Candidatus Korarchaeota archaeon]